MLSLNVVPRENRPLTDQIVMGVKRQIDDRQLRPGTRLPSIRTFAETHGVSRFTVVEAYDRLVAMGCLQSRRGAGFYVAARSEGAVPGAPEAHQHNEQLVWLIRRLLEAGDHPALAGGPWLPNSWQDESGIRQALSALARKNGAHLLEYGNPFGYLPLAYHHITRLIEVSDQPLRDDVRVQAVGVMLRLTPFKPQGVGE
jgi:DNA-binding transcriptional MocR family regulator